MKGFKNKKGISLIVLVITIIVMIILAAAIILSLSNSGIIGRSNEAKFKNDVSSMQEKLGVLDAEGALGNDQTAVSIESLTSSTEYREKFAVQEEKLKFVRAKLTVDELTWAEQIGIEPYAIELVNGQNGITINSDGVLFVDISKFNLTDIVIPEGVKDISSLSFYCYTFLKSVTIPSSLTTLGSFAFEGCNSLNSVKFPENINSTNCIIDVCAFKNCTSLTSITIPNGVKTVCESAFLNCESLTSITIPSSVTTIDYTAFEGCKSLKNITIEGTERFDADDVKSWFSVTDISDITITGSGYAG